MPPGRGRVACGPLAALSAWLDAQYHAVDAAAHDAPPPLPDAYGVSLALTCHTRVDIERVSAFVSHRSPELADAVSPGMQASYGTTNVMLGG
ncbi:hypothetical protein MSPP1_000472 [Malassezia sp. CBS 17886]|nr:hypothetical protein MSPP1_000472 [Malassezia sp. CBS 17886]